MWNVQCRLSPQPYVGNALERASGNNAGIAATQPILH